MAKATVAALRTAPDRVLHDYERLFTLGGAQQHLDPGSRTILKDNISWHFPFPGANTTPWQLEGSIVFPEGIHVPDFFFGKNVVHLPTVKCHIYTTTTGAMKNAFGGLLNTRRHYTHSWIHETLVDLLAIQKEIHSGLFAVMDGTTAGNGPGPRTMFPEIKNVILGSGDQVAIDAVAAKLMGFDPLSIPYIRLAHEKGLGVGDPRQIELVGDTDLTHESWGFQVGDNGASRVGDIVWFGPLKPVQNLFMRTPLVNLFIFGSEAYHDYYRWPVRDRKTFESWLMSDWGKLFLEYRQSGALAKAA